LTAGGNLVVAQAPPETKWPLSAVPQLQSNPGAARTIYLNFANEGVNAALGGRAYTIDQDRNTFTDTELADINFVWKGVAEKYSPWNVNVVTYAAPSGGGSWPNRMTMNIGDTSYRYQGPGMWRGLSGNPASIWPETLPLDMRFLSVASIVAHEAGHNYGLGHQEQYTASGQRFVIGGSSYLPGNNNIGPIMGHGFEPWSERSLWWNNNLNNQANSARDLDRLAYLGYRTDDYGDMPATATPFTVNGNALSQAGIITKTTDADYLSFTTTAAGPVTFRGDVAFPAPMLNLKLELQNSSGAVIATADTPSLGETLSVSNLAAGAYYLAVKSHGGYGDIGQYTVKGRLGSTPAVAKPTSLSATRVEDTVVRLNWSDNTSEETDYIVDRSNQGGPWRMIEMLGANTMEYYDRRAAGGVHYTYRVRAASDVLLSDYTNVAGADTPALADLAQPTSFRAVYNALTHIVDLSWTDNATRDWGYLVERKVGDEPWELLKYLYLCDNTSYQDTWPVDGVALYRVRALNDLGYSSPSAEVAVPEPGSLVLLVAAGLPVLAYCRRHLKHGWLLSLGGH
jgi:hypothetical protein